MTILETFIKLRDDLKTWVTNNLNKKANISYVDEKFDSISEFDPTEIQNAIDANTAAIDTKVDKVDGMNLSTNDYTTAEKNKLANIEAEANFYEHPTYTSKSIGLYKVAVDGFGHVSSATIVDKDDIVALGIPSENTVYDDSELINRIVGVENNITTTNETLAGVSHEFESYKTTNNDAVSTNTANIDTLKGLVGNIEVATQIDNAIDALNLDSTYAPKSHNHDTDYDAKGAAETALDSAKTYADSVATNIKNDLLNGAGATYDTLKELGDLIDINHDAIDALEIVAAGKADKVHIHAISDVINLQDTLDVKANTSHTHTISNITDLTATATELNYMDGVTSNVQAQLDNKAKSSDLTSHTNNKSNPHGVILSQLGVTATAAELNYVDGVTSNIQTQLNKKANDFSIEIYNGTGGNPKPVRFASFNYSSCDSENGIAAKISLVSGHGNGSSYAFLEDAIIRVTATGGVEVDNFKYYGAATGTYDGADRQYGDIFWLVDTTNKIVDFYVLMGQYARVYQTPWKRLTSSTGGTVTQYTSCTVYSSGDKAWANNSKIALMSDIPDGPDLSIYAAKANTLSGYGITDAYTNAQVDSALEAIETTIAGKANVSHTHVISNVSNLQSELDAINNKISSTCETKSDATEKLAEAIAYTDTKIANLINGAPTTLDTLGEIATAMEENEGVVEALEDAIGTKANASDLTSHINNKSNPHGVTASQVGAYSVSEIDNKVASIQSSLDGKAASSHGTHVSYSTTTPVMDGTASAGSASTVARSDHKHPTDTSRASKSEFDTHLGNTTIHITASERTNWNIAKTHADSAHAPSNAEKNQNAFSNVKVGTTTIAADTTTDTLNLVAGSNVTITPDATNDKITIAATDTTYSAAGSSLGLVKSGGDVTISNGVITVNDSSHNHDASNITSGTLSSDRLPTVPITKGGTGATTAAAALTNLGAQPQITWKSLSNQTATMASARVSHLSTLTLPDLGWYLIIVKATFNAGTFNGDARDGFIKMCISTNTSSYNNEDSVSGILVPGGSLQLNLTTFRVYSDMGEVNLLGYQQTGLDLSVNNIQITAIKLGSV